MIPGRRRHPGHAMTVVVLALLAGCGSSHPPAATATPVSSTPALSSQVTSSPVTSSAVPGPAGSSTSVGSSTPPTGPVPRFDHVVVVVEENRAYAEIIDNAAAPYLNALAAGGALFTRSYALLHPSEPNYLALFSGATHGLTDDSCPHSYAAPNLGSQLLGAGLSFAGYSDSLPSDGFTGCSSGPYARKHNPWVNFPNVPASGNRTLSRFGSNYAALPTVSFVIPNLDHDMHDGSVAGGDSWLKAHLDGYARWASTHNSLLIVTWDEDDRSAGNHIPTIFYGASVKVGRYAERITHYRVLRTLEAAYGLASLGGALPITDVWR